VRDIETLPLVTTVVGSYPVDGLPPRRAIQRAVEDQIAAGIDLISDGQVRGDMLAQFAARIPGFRRADDGVWEITDALDLPDTPAAATDYAFARGLAAGGAELKGVITGPLTLALTSRVAPSAPYTNPADPALILRLTEILGHEVAALVAAGARAVQVDEPALGAALGATVSPELAHDALRDLAALPRFPILHVCGDVRRVAEELLVLPFAVLDIENTRIANLAAFDPDQLDFASTVLSVGCVATDDAAVETVGAVRGRIEDALARLPAERLWLAPDCGLRHLSRDAARAKLAALAEAAQDARAAL
jgi:5-methyltetrahydropteroyltriglutamate--homocysteine methyltransferase